MEVLRAQKKGECEEASRETTESREHNLDYGALFCAILFCFRLILFCVVRYQKPHTFFAPP